MERKKKPNGLLISGLISALASLAIVAVAPGFAGNAPDKAQNASSQKDNDGDADSDSNTAYTEDNDTNDGGTKNNVSDDGDNAHPSGKDRSVENGKSGNQGKSESNPDDSKGPMRYEGAKGDDKPNGPGGTDLADQDGNNGCGNDDDFDDDNNGWCGRPKKSSPPKTCPDGSTMGADGKCSKGDTGGVGGGNQGCPDKPNMVQGKSCSEPDNDGRGPDRNESGRDKVEDGNNGCGNDADRMDDNEGWCGKKPDKVEADTDEVAPGKLCPAGTTMDENGNCMVDSVLGEQIDRDKNPSRPGVEVDAAAEEGPSVLGVRLSPALNKPVKVAGAVLPFTGGDVLLFLALALALFACGIVIMKATRFGSDHG